VAETANETETLTVDELSRFFNVLAHDLKSPIFSIDGFSDLLLADYAGKIDAEGEDFLRRIRSSAQQMKKVIDEMCHLVKLLTRAPERRNVVLKDLLDELRLKVNYLLEECGATLELDLRAATATADPELLKEVLSVLIRNAAFFSDRQQGERHVWVEISETAQATLFSVRDDGIGIDPRYADQIFELGIKLDKSRGGGPGYGLFLAKKAVEAMGGTMRVDSQLEGGSTFSFQLPR
jgi:signal transduction histidine kinase